MKYKFPARFLFKILPFFTKKNISLTNTSTHRHLEKVKLVPLEACILVTIQSALRMDKVSEPGNTLLWDLVQVNILLSNPLTSPPPTTNTAPSICPNASSLIPPPPSPRPLTV